MDGIQSVHIHNAMDCIGDNRTIRWTEVFFIENEDRGTSRCEPVDLSRLAETLARASCVALVPHLDLLKDAGLTRLALRATIDTERVGIVLECIFNIFGQSSFSIGVGRLYFI